MIQLHEPITIDFRDGGGNFHLIFTFVSMYTIILYK